MSTPPVEKKSGIGSAMSGVKDKVMKELDTFSIAYPKIFCTILLVGGLTALTSMCAGYTGPSSGPMPHAVQSYADGIKMVPDALNKYVGFAIEKFFSLFGIPMSFPAPMGFLLSMGLLGGGAAYYIHKHGDKGGTKKKIAYFVLIAVAFFAVNWFVRGMGETVFNGGKKVDFMPVPILSSVVELCGGHLPNFFPAGLPPMMMELGIGTLATVSATIAFGIGGLTEECLRNSKRSEFWKGLIRLIATLGAGAASVTGVMMMAHGTGDHPYMMLTSSAAPLGIASGLGGAIMCLAGMGIWMRGKPSGTVWLSEERMKEQLDKSQKTAAQRRRELERAADKRAIELAVLPSKP